MDNSIDGESGEYLFTLILDIPLVVFPLLLIIVILLLLSAVISGSEVAFFSLSPDQLEKCENSKKTAEQNIVSLLADPKILLATILILNNLVNVGIVTLATFASWQVWGRENEIVIIGLTIAITTAIVFFGEILPKVFANHRNLYFARSTSSFLLISMNLLKPFSWLLLWMGDLLEKRIKRRGYEVSMQELNEAVEMTTNSGSTIEEKDILKGIVNFGTKTARQTMRSRIDITAFDIEEDFEYVLQEINKSGLSRLPVYNDTIDKIEGILYIKDLLPYLDKDKTFGWQGLIRRDTFFVPEHKKIDELLKDFQEKRVHIAIVVDEYGGTSGLITMEDIIEEIVGEINDEFDTSDPIFKKIDKSTFTFEGKTSLNDFCKILDIDPEVFNDAKGESESLGGLLLELFSKLPTPGEQVKFRDFVFTAVSVDKKRIKSVRVLIKNRIEKTVI